MNSILKKFIIFIGIIFACLFIADQGTFSIAVNGSNLIDYVYLFIFLFIVFFFITFKEWKKTTRKQIITFIIIYCCLNVYIVSTNFGIMCIKRPSVSSRHKSCWSNIRVITGAVEMYNMDNDTMMKELDIPLLVKNKYLYSAPSKVEKDCEYLSFGDLTEDGFVYCILHAVPNIPDYFFSSSNEYSESFKSKDCPVKYDLLMQLKNEIQTIKAKLNKKKPLIVRIKVFLKDEKSHFNLFRPLVVLFFPFFLHQLGD